MCTCILPGKAVPEMTYTVSGGTLNPADLLLYGKEMLYMCLVTIFLCAVCRTMNIIFLGCHFFTLSVIE